MATTSLSLGEHWEAYIKRWIGRVGRFPALCRRGGFARPLAACGQHDPTARGEPWLAENASAIALICIAHN